MKKIIKEILKRIISFIYWDGDKTLHRIFSEDLYLQKKIRYFNYSILKNKKLSLLLINSIPTPEGKSLKFLTKEIQTHYLKKHPIQSDETKMCLIRILYEKQLCDDIVFSELLNFAEETNNSEYRYWATQIADTFAFHRTISLPSSFYSRRKELFKTICIENSINQPVKREAENTSKNRICILTYVMEPSLKNSSQRVLKMITDNLDQNEFDIYVLCIDSFTSKKYNILNYTGWKDSYKENKKISALLGKSIKTYYCRKKNPIDKIQEGIDKIYSINPDFIIDMTDEYSVGSYIYSKDFKTMYLPLRGKVTASYCTYYKASIPEETIAQSHKYLDILSNIQIINWSFPEYVLKPSHIYTREQFSFSKDDFLIASAGIIPANDYFFINTMLKTLDNNKNFKWIIIGSALSAGIKNRIEEYITNKKIIDWGYENDLAALYKICDIFVTPNKTGGSGTVAIAAQQKLPIVISNYPSDAIRWIKIQNTIQNGYDGFVTEIEKLASDSAYYTSKANLFFELVTQACDTKEKWLQFNSILKDLIQNGE